MIAGFPNNMQDSCQQVVSDNFTWAWLKRAEEARTLCDGIELQNKRQVEVV
jgi:hypothetical protein